MLEGVLSGALSFAIASTSSAPEGVIAGGWGYAIAAYIITAAGLLAYAWSLRYRRQNIDRKEQSS
jgi:hypothetical protein